MDATLAHRVMPARRPARARLAAGAVAVVIAVVAASAGAVNASAPPTVPRVVTGVATHLDRSALPPTATFEATVEDVSVADAPARAIGRTSQRAGQVPIRFEIPIDAAAVQANRRYSVRARILVDGRMLYTSDRVAPVLTMGAGTHVEIRMIRTQAVGAPAPAPEMPTLPPDRALENTYWKLVALRGTPATVANGQREPHLILQPQNSRVTGSGGCNSFTGPYALKGGTLRFGRAAATMMACADGMAQEQAYFAALDQVRRWRVRGDTLELLDAAGVPVLALQALDLS
jgi:putative lipoprotein